MGSNLSNEVSNGNYRAVVFILCRSPDGLALEVLVKCINDMRESFLQADRSAERRKRGTKPVPLPVFSARSAGIFFNAVDQQTALFAHKSYLEVLHAFFTKLQVNHRGVLR